MQRLRVRLGTLAVGCGMAVLTLAGSPALASSRPAASHQAGRSVTGLELISGKHKGQCNNSNNAPIRDWTDTWLARIVLTVR
jgi:hypothetical protein